MPPIYSSWPSDSANLVSVAMSATSHLLGGSWYSRTIGADHLCCICVVCKRYGCELIFEKRNFDFHGTGYTILDVPERMVTRE